MRRTHGPGGGGVLITTVAEKKGKFMGWIELSSTSETIRRGTFCRWPAMRLQEISTIALGGPGHETGSIALALHHCTLQVHYRLASIEFCGQEARHGIKGPQKAVKFPLGNFSVQISPRRTMFLALYLPTKRKP